MKKQEPANKIGNLKTAKDVLNTESQALMTLAGALDESFMKAIEAIETIKQPEKLGRLIIGGIGKSGHVARKIAATMASTGTPAYFVHPGEASHGDLGMITENDVVLMISNSGENSELSDLIHYTRRFGITLIAITSNPESTLANHSDINLLMPKAQEACPNGLAPTTSTTMMMALGDALAIVLLERMALTPEQFKTFHPGGKLGQKLRKVKDLMIPKTDMAMIKAETLMDQAILTMTEKNQGAMVIIDDSENLKGIITDGDLKRHMADDLLKKSAAEIMSESPKSIQANALAAEALDIMTKQDGQYLTSLIVMDTEKFVGMIRLQDCLKAGIV